MKRRKLRKPRFYSLRETIKWATTYIAGIAIVFGLLPSEAQSSVLQFVGVKESSVPAVIGILFILARIWKQGPREEDEVAPDSADTADESQEHQQ